MIQLIDTHAHLEEIANLEPAIEAAREAGVIAIVAVGSDEKSNRKILELAQRYKGFVQPAIGYHPWNIVIDEIDKNLEYIESHISEVVAVGEVGLDYHKRVRARADKDVQKEVFRRILQIARRHNTPVLIHTRYAWQDAFDLVKEVQIEKAVFHWYTGTSSVLRKIIENKYYLSATPAIEYHAEHSRAIKECPLERLLLETDSPVVYHRGTAAEFAAHPADVLRVLKGLARLRGMDETELAEITTRNAFELFGLKMK